MAKGIENVCSMHSVRQYWIGPAAIFILAQCAAVANLEN
jgi:hypothetical protein